MRRWVLEMGAQRMKPLVDVLRLLTNGFSCEIAVLRREAARALEYSDTCESVDRIWRELEYGEIVSVRLRPDNQRSAFAIVNSPEFEDGGRAYWYAAHEWECEEAPPSLEEFLEPDLDFVAISVEEGLDLPMRRVTAATFPWEHWRLRAGGTRDEFGRWTIREGPKSE